MVCFRRVVLGTIASGIMLLCAVGDAGEIYNNLPSNSTYYGTDPIASDGPAYNSFSTGHSASVLTDVRMMLSGIPSTSASFTVSLLSDSSTHPGSVLTTLGTFKDSTLTVGGTSGGSVYDVSLTTPYALAADTRYWIELSGSGSSVAWDYASDDSGTGVSGEFWAYTPLGVTTVSPNSPGANGPFQMAVTTASASPGPEPGTFCQALSAIAIGSFVMVRRRFVRS